MLESSYQMKKNCIALGLLSFTLVCCDDARIGDKAMLVIDTYSDEKSTGTIAHGDFDSSPVKLYIDDVYVGTTPMTFRESDLKRLNLPSFERVQTEKGHWDTWDLGKDSTITIGFKETPKQKRKLDFRVGGGSTEEIKKFTGYTGGQNSEGARTMLIEFKTEESDDATD